MASSTAAASAGPVRRNFVGGSSRKNGSAVRFLFLAFVAVVIALSATAVHLSRRVMQQSSLHRHGLDDRPANTKVDDAPKKAAAAAVSPAAADIKRPANKAVAPISDGKDRVYCMVPFIWNEEMYNVIMETWGKRCDVINFLCDSIVGGKLKGDKITEGKEGYRPYWEYPEGTFPDNVKFINMTRTWNDCPENDKGEKKVCRHIWEKMWRSWVYVEENHLDQAEWFCKVDYDTFFFPENVKHFVRHKHWDPINEYHYFGHLMLHRQKHRDPMILGAAACWSRKTLDDIADVYRAMPKGSMKGERGKCEDRAQATEEASTSLCLKMHLNVSAYPARDDQVRETIAVAKYKDVLKWNRTEQGEWWYWKGKPENAGQEENAISDHPIGLHKYKTDWEIRELEQHFYGPPDNKYIKAMNPRTKTYVMNVRKAVGTDK